MSERQAVRLAYRFHKSNRSHGADTGVFHVQLLSFLPAMRLQKVKDKS